MPYNTNRPEMVAFHVPVDEINYYINNDIKILHF